LTLRERFGAFQGFSLAYLGSFAQAHIMTFAEAKKNLLDSRRAWYAGSGTKEKMIDCAKRAAYIYNQRAKEIALEKGMKPRLISPAQIMRSIDRAR
jgi:hypothetical protein